MACGLVGAIVGADVRKSFVVILLDTLGVPLVRKFSSRRAEEQIDPSADALGL